MVNSSWLMEHRFTCATTCPNEGWPTPPSEVQAMVALLPCPRRRHLQLRGFLAVRISVPPFQQGGTFTWFVMPPEDTHTRNDTTWYCDGSLLHGKWKAIRWHGFRHCGCHKLRRAARVWIWLATLLVRDCGDRRSLGAFRCPQPVPIRAQDSHRLSCVSHHRARWP